MSDLVDYLGGGAHSNYDEVIAQLPPALRNVLGQPDDWPEILSGDRRIPFPTDIDGDEIIYNSYSGVDIVATIVLPNEPPINLGELQTLSYSIHRENTPVRLLGHVSPAGFVKGPRTIAGSMIFTVFNNYAFYRLRQFQKAIEHSLYPVADMLPPIDMVITFANEFGTLSKMKLLGITFIDEGGTMSIDDLIQEQTYTYMARGIQPMTGYFLPEEES